MSTATCALKVRQHKNGRKTLAIPRNNLVGKNFQNMILCRIFTSENLNFSFGSVPSPERRISISVILNPGSSLKTFSPVESTLPDEKFGSTCHRSSANFSPSSSKESHASWRSRLIFRGAKSPELRSAEMQCVTL